jgi:23S rRNA (adenine2503-C2)-methyltransferase
MKHETLKSEDGTVLLTFPEGYKTVIIPFKSSKNTVCFSTQIGCKMNCAFCRAGTFKRDLGVQEIVSQFESANELIDGEITGMVFMGMGEPMLNYNSVKMALEELHEKYSIAYRHITLSTCGINLKLLEKVKFHVAISLHTPFDEERKKLVPGAAKVNEIVEFSKAYGPQHKDGLMIEYTMIDGVNDTDKHLDELMKLDWHTNTIFNLIEFNEFGNFKRSSKMSEWREKIIEKDYKCFKRLSRGADIEAACGMLN